MEARASGKRGAPGRAALAGAPTPPPPARVLAAAPRLFLGLWGRVKQAGERSGYRRLRMLALNRKVGDGCFLGERRGSRLPEPPQPCAPGDQAFVTLTTNDAYAKGALVLGSSLKQHRTTRRLAVLITPQVSDSMRKALEIVFDEVISVDVLDSGDSAHLTLMKRPELGVTLTKLHCWALTQYSKCVFMDADTLVLANIDELFEREEFSAAPDPGWPDCFNSGVFVYRPSAETYNQLLHSASEKGSFDGGDQGLLNTFFSRWATADIRKHLPFIYNLSSISIYSYLPAFKAFGKNAKVVHFLGQVKPWNYAYDPKTRSVKGDAHDPSMIHPEFLNMWWEVFTTNVLPLLQQFGLVKDSFSYMNVLSDLVYTLAFSCGFCRKEEVSGAISHLSLGEIPPTVQPFVSSEERKERWEQGQADYMGADSFDNIKRKLDTYLQ
ncbi:PREDICTED: glycogenin-1 [Elephantulus edwardii]|uniref:glycogenin-1 n=1 Tax=Elephantulus edwardii TaxID=28737 RepID=UPI0003F0A387|nr:PREDICTED: glycogenin-1 [Elephantulus edwardii]